MVSAVRKNACHVATNVIGEARTLAAFLIEIERGRCGGDVEVAIHRAAMIYGVEEGALRSLRYRWRDLHDIKASVLERLREAYEAVYERERRLHQVQQQIDATVASPAFELVDA